MTNSPIKITKLSEDFTLKSKDVIDILKDFDIDKKTGGSVDRDEYELFLSALTEKHQIKDLEGYRSGRSKISTVKEKKDAPKVEEPYPVREQASALPFSEARQPSAEA